MEVKEEMMMNKLRKNAKALSPIFATLILIAIAVIAGIVVYMFTSGTMSSMTGGGTAGQEKIAIQAVTGVANTTLDTSTNVTLFAQSTGGGPVALDSAILKNAQGTVLAVVNATAIVENPENPDTSAPTVLADLTRIDIDFATTPDTVVGEAYTVTLVTKLGGSFVSQSFKATAL